MPTPFGATGSGHEVGAAVAVYRDGRKVVDLWGGYRNGTTRAPWERDTIVTVFSTTKGVAALTVALAASRGVVDYDARVADYWPEFAQAGKGAVTVRQLLGHQAGLPVIKPPLTLADIADPEKLSKKIAARLLWPPGAGMVTTRSLGWYESNSSVTRTRRDAHSADTSPRRSQCHSTWTSISGCLPLWTATGWRYCIRSPSVTLLHLNTVPPRLAAAFVSPFSLVGRAAPSLQASRKLTR